MRNLLQSALAGLILAAMAVCGCNQQAQHQEFSSAVDEGWEAGAGKPPSAKTLYAFSKILLDQGKDEQAQEMLERITLEYPSFAPAYVDLAEIHMRRRNPDLAIETLIGGLSQCPDDSMMVNDIGMCHIVKGNYDKALVSFQQACGAAPQNTRYRTNLALALGMLGRYEESLAIYEQLLQPADAHYNLAVICEARKDFDRAAMEFELAKMTFGPAPKPSTLPATQPAK